MIHMKLDYLGRKDTIKLNYVSLREKFNHTYTHTHTHSDKILYNKSLQMVSWQSYHYWLGLFTSTLLWPDTTSISISPSGPISATAPLLPLMSPSTSPHILHLSTCGPTLHSNSSPPLKQPLIPFSTPLYFFSKPLAPLIPSFCLNLTLHSVYLPKTLLSSLWHTHPPCYFAVPSAE